jgi:RNA polymerase sigma-70 factor (ECF subfamily)
MEMMPIEPEIPADIAEPALLLAAKKGDHAAYGELVRRYQAAIYRLAYRILRRQADAEDATQEAFVRAYVHLDSYNERFRFYTWLAAITSHYCYRMLRGRQAFTLPDEGREMQPAFVEDGPELFLLLRERHDEIQRMLAALPERSRELLVLRHWHSLSYEELAAATGQSLSAVKSQLFRARRELAKRLRDNGYSGATA